MEEGWHFDGRVRGFHAMQQQGFCRIAGSDECCIGEAEIIADGTAKDSLFREWRAKARVPLGTSAVGAMAVGAVGIEIGTHADSRSK